jgi:Ca2+:H+ antiporter
MTLPRRDASIGIFTAKDAMTQDELEVTQDVSATAHAPGLPPWTIAAPVFGGAVLAGTMLGLGGFYVALLAIGLAVCVFASVFHAETIAHRVGEPYGTLVLALAVTLIEVALIISLMLGGGPDTATLARDTIFAAVMIILTAIVGLSLFMGGLKYREQEFGLDGTTAALVALAAIVVLTLVFPNYTETPGPYYSSSQLAFISVISIVIYGSFVFAQTVSNRPLFVSEGVTSDGAGGGDADPVHAHPPPSNKVALASSVLLLLCLAAVVLLAKKIAPSLEAAVERVGAPNSVVGVIIAAIVLLPEGLSAVAAARDNRLQTSLNLALGSALASIGLTIPAVGALAIYLGIPLALGIDNRSTVLVILALFTASLALRTGRTIVLHGIVLLVIFAVYLFMTIVP